MEPPPVPMPPIDSWKGILVAEASRGMAIAAPTVQQSDTGRVVQRVSGGTPREHRRSPALHVGATGRGCPRGREPLLTLLADLGFAARVETAIPSPRPGNAACRHPGQQGIAIPPVASRHRHQLHRCRAPKSRLCATALTGSGEHAEHGAAVHGGLLGAHNHGRRPRGPGDLGAARREQARDRAGSAAEPPPPLTIVDERSRGAIIASPGGRRRGCHHGDLPREPAWWPLLQLQWVSVGVRGTRWPWG